jgi:hypothetical protein
MWKLDARAWSESIKSENAVAQVLVVSMMVDPAAVLNESMHTVAVGIESPLIVVVASVRDFIHFFKTYSKNRFFLHAVTTLSEQVAPLSPIRYVITINSGIVFIPTNKALIENKI